MTGARVASALRIGTAALTLALTMAGCGSGSGADGETGAPPADAITMSVTAAKAAIAPMRRELRLLGATAALRQVQLRAPAAGRVIGLNLQTGDIVHRGEVVAHVINREIEAAQNGLAVARQLDPGEAGALAASVKRYSGGSGVAVVAADDGVVAQRLVSSGQLVNDMDPLANLIDPRSIYVEAQVPTDELGRIRPGMDATVTAPMISGELPARIAALSPALGSTGSTTPVRVEFIGGARLTQAGAPVEVSVTIADNPAALAIPAAALFQDAAEQTFHVFVAGVDGRAHRTPVTIGIRQAERVEIGSGLKPGDLVITSGGYALSDGLKIKVTGPTP